MTREENDMRRFNNAFSRAPNFHKTTFGFLHFEGILFNMTPGEPSNQVKS